MDVAAQRAAGPPREASFRIKRRVALAFAAIVVVACAIAAALVFSRAQTERQAVRDRALNAAIALSFGFDQEVAAGNALLRGLSSSPALRAGDARAFYDQLKGTPIPEGSWLILQDLEGQVVNTLRPFGAALPKHRDFPTYPETLNRVRERGWTVSGRMSSLVKPGTSIIALSLRINDFDGVMTGFLTTILSQDHLGVILRDQKLPEEWTGGLYDRRFQPIVSERGSETTSLISMPDALRKHLANGSQNDTAEGFLEGVDERGIPVLVAYRSSGSTNWITTVAVPLSTVNAPVESVLWQMAGPAGLLLLASSLAALLTARQVEQPLKALSHLVTAAKGEVTELSTQLLALQEDERQRIARELHDSTAQRIVAANLGLLRLERKVRHDPTALTVLDDIGKMLEGALTELRIFTYLLHPPNLASDGLVGTLREFIDGFAGRTGLRPTTRLSDAIDGAPPEIQRSILRVVQQALANVHRHAGASRVHVGARLAAGCLIVRISDDGRGIPASEVSAKRPRLGVGIPGMHLRLQQFGGDLRIRTGADGTSLLAYVPLPEPSKISAVPLRTARVL
jgi:signal transduction histidine kinase